MKDVEGSLVRLIPVLLAPQPVPLEAVGDERRDAGGDKLL